MNNKNTCKILTIFISLFECTVIGIWFTSFNLVNKSGLNHVMLTKLEHGLNDIGLNVNYIHLHESIFIL